MSRLSLRISPSGSVALVGPSGSGKSTCARLLCRLFDPAAGAVLVCGWDVRAVSQHSLRSCISCVTQDTVLFNSSVQFNLCYGAPEATEAQMRTACRVARVDEFVRRLELGLETQVGERGLKLSGGEKQRLGIARALLREPTVLILDEATSSLDSETEREVQVALDDAAKGRCTLCIAHRLSTIAQCEEIIVLAAGAAVERGTHASLLLRPNGLYASMWAKQTVEEKDGGQGARAGSEVARLSPEECKSSVDATCGVSTMQSDIACTASAIGQGYAPPVIAAADAMDRPPACHSTASALKAVESSMGHSSLSATITGTVGGGLIGCGNSVGGGSISTAGGGDGGGSDGDAEEQKSAQPSKNANEKAELDVRFLLDLWLLLHIGIDRHPPLVLCSELLLATALTALALWLLPIPTTYLVASAANRWSDRPLGAAMIGLLIAIALILPIRHASKGEGSKEGGEGEGEGTGGGRGGGRGGGGGGRKEEQ